MGKIKEKYLKDAIAEYSKRLSRFCDFSITELPDFADDDVSTEKESALILQKMNGCSILLDLKGEQITSVGIAKIIDKAYSSGSDTVSFIIGGSNGVDQRVKAAASKAIAFGNITFPHQLMRLVLTEQIYRAFNICANTPYHK